MHTNRKEWLVSRLGRGGQTGRGLPGTALVRADAEVLEMMVVRVALNGEALRPVAGHVTTVTFMLCVFYHNNKKREGREPQDTL